MLQINNLSATVADKPILKGLSLSINAGEIHAIMGPNGAGKSTLAYVLGGRPGYEVTGGSVTFTPSRRPGLDPGSRLNSDTAPEGSGAPGQARGDVDLLAWPRTARRRGPVPRLPVSGRNSRRLLRPVPARGGQLPAQASWAGAAVGGEFLKLAREKAALLRMDMDMLKRPVNVGFSGGEKKRAEMVQMGILDPSFAVLDETDSGLDIDALRIVGEGINAIMRRPDKAVLLITHYQRLLDYVKPDFVHVLAGGRIVKTGGAELALQLEEEGYEAVAA